MVCALESLSRHYGQSPESIKALGIGYAKLGEGTRAAEFLRQALEQTPDDLDLRRFFIDVLHADGSYEEAARLGQEMLSSASGIPRDDDVAMLALALAALGDVSAAQATLDAYPNLDRRNPIVNKAYREVKQTDSSLFSSIIARVGPLGRLLSALPIKELRSGREGAVGQTSPHGVRKAPVPANGSAADPKQPAEAGPQAARTVPPRSLHMLVEYWIYAAQNEAPELESVEEKLTDLASDTEEREWMLNTMKVLMDKQELSVEYVRRPEARELFDYPDELIPRNSRELSEADRQIVYNAQVIARLRLVQPSFTGLKLLGFAAKLVEAIRLLSGGVVQDAVSHTLWGTEEWRKRIIAAASSDPIAAHVQFEVLDEGKSLWLHSHGMQKFGLPEIELEEVPPDQAAAALRVINMVAETLLRARENGPLDYRKSFSIDKTPFIFKVGPTPRDAEGHFPIGSLKVLPYVADYDPHTPDTIRHVLRMLSWRRGKGQSEARAADAAKRASGQTAEQDRGRSPRELILTAHKKARSELPEFRKSFQEKGDQSATVYAVKIGFPVQGESYEWMWVSVEAWRRDLIVGRLENEPVLRKDLSKGGRIQVSEGQVFDWVIAQNGCVIKGAYTESASAAGGLNAGASPEASQARAEPR
jgi:uncharacterized protein YegJ (DUF2314 family)/tetratricopeptide (TPR) repeat protein